MIKFLKCTEVGEAYEMQELPGERAAQPGIRPGSYSSATKLEGGFLALLRLVRHTMPPRITVAAPGLARARASPSAVLEAVIPRGVMPTRMVEPGGHPFVSVSVRQGEVMSLLEVMTLLME